FDYPGEVSEAAAHSSLGQVHGYQSTWRFGYLRNLWHLACDRLSKKATTTGGHSITYYLDALAGCQRDALTVVVIFDELELHFELNFHVVKSGQISCK